MLGLEAISPLLRAKNIALRAMGQITPAGVVARRKYEAELDYWRGELNNLNLWFNEKSTDWWGIDPPDDAEKVVRSNLWQTNAVLTMHKLRPTYYEELGLEADAFEEKGSLRSGAARSCLFNNSRLASVTVSIPWPISTWPAVGRYSITT